MFNAWAKYWRKKKSIPSPGKINITKLRLGYSSTIVDDPLSLILIL